MMCIWIFPKKTRLYNFKKKFMKKGLLLVAAILMMVAAHAQKGKIAVGGGLAYGTEVEKLGIDLRGIYGITDKIDAAPSFTYFFPNKEDFLDGEIKVTWWELNLNGHYNFMVKEQYSVYGIAGLNFSRVGWKAEYTMPGYGFTDDEKVDESDGEMKVGLNLGAGGQYNVNEKMGVFLDMKYVIVSDYDQLVFNFGVLFNIN